MIPYNQLRGASRDTSRIYRNNTDDQPSGFSAKLEQRLPRLSCLVTHDPAQDDASSVFDASILTDRQLPGGGQLRLVARARLLER
jgi:hypothetical protein